MDQFSLPFGLMQKQELNRALECTSRHHFSSFYSASLSLEKPAMLPIVHALHAEVIFFTQQIFLEKKVVHSQI